MTQGYAQQQAPREDAELSFKRHILEKTASYPSDPMADLYRVEMLGQMLDRYDELMAKGLVSEAAVRRTKADYNDAAEQMRQAGFATIYEQRASSRWPEMTEDEAAAYIRQSSAQQHKSALGIGLCSACVMPLMILIGLSEMFIGYVGDTASLLGLAGMFAMIGVGVYAITTAKTPDDEKKVKKGRFGLGTALRAKLHKLREAVNEKARRRRGLGIALCAACVLPIFIGGALDSMWWGFSDAWVILGVGGMFGMIGAGVYELVMADGEKKTMKKLLGKERE